MNPNSALLPSKLVSFTAVGTTLVINPWFAFDPINLPKMMYLSVATSIMGAILLFHIKDLLKVDKTVLCLFACLFASLTISILVNDAPFIQQFFGTWGRSTGLLTYASFMILTLYTATFLNKKSISHLRKVFEKLSYFISFYTLIQWAELDPINWSQKLMVATLGNINFMSSFLGLATCSFLTRVIFEKEAVSSKVFYVALSLTNLSLILISGSIQGLAIILTGLWLILIISTKKAFGKAQALLAMSFSTIGGVLLFLGTGGRGPFSIFAQDTVVYRLDYWRAGIRMTRDNPFFGIGIDSYGDYYRLYRDMAAVNRTGPQRVTNTAHNIFLDVSSGSGVFAGISFVLIFAFICVLIAQLIFSNSIDADLIAWSSIFLGFFVFCLISINQIGVGVWGFVSIGIMLANNRIQSDSKLRSSEVVKKGKLSGSSKFEFDSESFRLGSGKAFTLKLILTATIVFIATLVTIRPNVTDAQFLSEKKQGDLEKVLQLAQDPFAMDIHKELAIKSLVEADRIGEALDLANQGIRQNPRNWFYWVSVAFNPLATESERREAALRLTELDPNNLAVRQDLKELLDSPTAG